MVLRAAEARRAAAYSQRSVSVAWKRCSWFVYDICRFVKHHLANLGSGEYWSCPKLLEDKLLQPSGRLMSLSAIARPNQGA
ncbi:hypothetical protein NDU88_009462 [Pleurodeles waltl]|uniref:Uncharacterized protein n=1 Tax=Pleurodeles waltl TaxID=8319 RepID=A0AAV7RZ32_PLEWA|nr:hypothetical protein NDU88_009462 [Pleurodeles waltl]